MKGWSSLLWRTVDPVHQSAAVPKAGLQVLRLALDYGLGAAQQERLLGGKEDPNAVLEDHEAGGD